MLKRHFQLIVAIVIFVCILSISIGYSALNSNLTISGEAIVNPTKQMRVSSITVKEFVDGGYETYSNIFTNDSTEMHVTLPNNSSKVIYEVTLENSTPHSYLLSNIEELVSNNPNIIWEVRNITFSTKIGHGTTVFELVLSHKNTNTVNESASINLKYYFELFDNYKDTILAGADPILTTGLIPVVIEADGSVLKADVSSNWYNYNEKQWANAVMISDENNRNTYNDAIGGTEIDASHISVYYVWIPRYEYQIWDEIQVSPAWGEDKTEMQEINIRFVDTNTPKKTITSLGEWYTHPAFSYNDGVSTTEVNGFWVNKFELTGTLSAPTSLPSSKPLRNINLSTYFSTIKSFENLYMNNNDKVDSHGIKNSEWSAVAYLSLSLYGKNSEVLPNNYSSQITGCGANIGSVGGNSACLNAFGTVLSNEYNSSTSGNISGVFDMSGCLWERTMGLQKNSLGEIDFASSGFTSLNPKYYDVYEYSTSGNQYGNSGYGQAISETAGWYGDFSTIPNGNTNHWTLRSGDQNSGISSGIFAFMTSSGTSYWTHNTRGTMWVYD